MAIPVTNDFTGRIWRIVTPGTSPLANVKVKGGMWTGGTAADQLSFVDAAGREYDFIYPGSGNALSIPEIGWLSGPITITAIPHGELQLYIGTK